ncbi:O-antigen ligase family protein [bacterium]|nr:O-antigen ligase family protein [bacterium]
MKKNSRAARFSQLWRSDLDLALLCFLFFSLPFERIPSIQAGPVTLRLSLFAGAAVILRTAYLLATRKLQFKLDFPSALLLAFSIWIAVLLPLSLNLQRGAMVLIFTFFTIAVAFSIRQLYRPEHLKPILKSLAFSTAIVLAFCGYQYIGNLVGLPNWATGLRERYSWQVFGFPRIQGMSLEPLYLASFLILPFSLLFAWLVNKHKAVRSWYFGAALFAISCAIFMTVSRGGIVAALAAVGVISAVSVLWRVVSWKRLAVSVGLVLLGFAVGFLIVSVFNKLPENLRLTNGKRGSAALTNQLTKTGLETGGDERSKVRGLATSIIKKSPRNFLIGIGPGQFGPYVQPNKQGGDGWWIVNNELLELWVEYGLIGLMLMGAFLLALCLKLLTSIKSVRTQGFVAIALLAFVVAEVIQYQTFSTLYIIHIWAGIGLGLGIASHAPELHAKRQ